MPQTIDSAGRDVWTQADEERRRKKKEEERRRQAAAKVEQYVPFSAGWTTPSGGKTQAVKVPTKKVGAVRGKNYLSPRTSSQESIKQFVKENSTAAKSTPVNGFYTMAKKLGGDEASKRLLQAVNIWRRYYAPYGGPEMVWTIADSPYSMAELEEMGPKGHEVLFNIRAYDAYGNYLPAAWNTTSKTNNFLRGALNDRRPLGPGRNAIGVGGWWAEDKSDGVKTYVDQDVVGNYTLAGQYVVNPYGPGVIMPSQLLKTNENYIKKSEEFAVSTEFMRNLEFFGQELHNKNPKVYQEVEEATGINVADKGSYQEWELSIKQKYGEDTALWPEDVQRAWDKFAQARTDYNFTEHGDVMNAHIKRAGIKLAESAATAYFIYLTGKGMGTFPAQGLLGKVFTGLGVTYFGGQAAQTKFDPYEKLAERTEKLKTEFEAEFKTTAQRQYEDTLRMISDLEEAGDRETSIKAQKALQEPIYAEDGTLIRPRLGYGLVADGKWTNEWKAVVAQDTDMSIRMVSEMQQLLIQGNYADEDLKITGSWEKWDEDKKEYVPDEDWQKALDRGQAAWAAEAKMMEDHPKAYVFMKNQGAPMSWGAFKALVGSLDNEGIPSVGFKALALAGHTVGNLSQSIPAIIETSKYLEHDNLRNQLGEQLAQAVVPKLSEVDLTNVPFDVEPGDIDGNQALWLVENGYIPNTPENATLIALAAGMNKREVEILNENTFGLIGAVAQLTTEDGAKTAETLKKNQDLVHLGNMAILIGGQAMIGRGMKFSHKGIDRTPEAFLADKTAQKDLRRIIKLVEGDPDVPADFGNVADYVGGVDRRVYAQRLGAYRYGHDIHTVEAEHVKTLANQVVQAARDGDIGRVKDLTQGLNKATDGDAYAKQLIESVKKYDQRLEKNKTKIYEEYSERREAKEADIAANYDAVTDKRLNTVRQRERNARGKLERDLAAYASREKARLVERYGADHPNISRALSERVNRRRRTLEDRHNAKYRAQEERVANERSAGRDEYLSTRAEGWVGSHAPRTARAGRYSIEEIIASRLVYRQRGKGDVWGTQSVAGEAQRLAAEMWGGTGRDGKHYDIFPHFTDRQLKSASWRRISLERSIAGMKNPRMRGIAEGILLGAYRAPLHKAPIDAQAFAGRVADFVAALTNDIQLANRWRTKATMTDFSKPRAAHRFEAELQGLRGDYLLVEPHTANWFNKMDESMTTSPDLGATNQLSGLKLTSPEGKVADQIQGEKREVVMNEQQLKYEIMLGRDVMLAKRRGNGWTTVNNMVRGLERTLNTASTPMRVVSVGAGGLILFQKHMLADTMRTLVSLGAGGLRARHNKRLLDRNVGELPPEVAQKVLYDRELFIQTELHYNMDGGLNAKRIAKKAYDQRGRPRNMSAAVDTVRRIIDNPAYRAYVRNGTQGLHAYLSSDAGKLFLKKSGALQDTAKVMTELGTPLKGKALMEQAIELYTAKNEKLFDDYAHLPVLNRAMTDIATGAVARTDTNIRKAIETAHKAGENPTVDTPVNSGNMVIDWFAHRTEQAMYFNKWNRAAVYDKVYNDTFKELTENQKMTAVEAAPIAASVARLRGQQIHFDLSYALRAEMKHRHAAWFFTKHRLWSTWLAQAALRYPGYAGALVEFENWMQDRNDDPSIPEWEKNNVTFALPGIGEVSINLAPYLWMTSYAIESPLALIGEDVFTSSINQVFGTDLKPTKSEFKFSISRLDPAIMSMYRLIKAPLRDGDEEDWTEYISTLPEKEREKFIDEAITYWALGQQEDGTNERSIEDACAHVVLGNVVHEALRFGKPSSSRIYTEDDIYMRNAMKDFSQLSNQISRSEYLRSNPRFAAAIGAKDADTPYEQEELVSAITLYNQYRNEYSQQVLEATRNGNIEDPQFAQNMYEGYIIKVDKLKADAPIFKRWMGDMGEDPKTWQQVAQVIFPSITEEEWEEARIPTKEETDIYVDTALTPKFEEACRALNLNPGSTSAAVQMLRQRYITIPKAIFQKQLPGDLTDAVRNNANIITAAGGVGGKFRSTQYIEMMLNNRKRDLWMTGTKYGKPDANNLVMMNLTPEEKQWLGWTTSAKAEELWFNYAIQRTMISDALALQNKGPSSTAYREAMAALDDEVWSSWLDQDETFAKEWYFSHMRLDERMQELGYGTHDTEASRGWADFFGIMNGFWTDLSKIYNKSYKKMGVSPMAQSAADTGRQYLAEVVKLSESNPGWYKQWKLMKLGPSKFGFYSKWKLEDGSDWDLWARDTPIDEEEYIYVWGEE